LPMFLLAHGADTRWTRRSIVLLASAIPLLALGLNAHIAAASWLAVVLMEAGLGCFLYQARLFHRVRIRRRVDVGMRFAAAGFGFLGAAALIGPVVLWRGPA